MRHYSTDWSTRQDREYVSSLLAEGWTSPPAEYEWLCNRRRSFHNGKHSSSRQPREYSWRWADRRYRWWRGCSARPFQTWNRRRRTTVRARRHHRVTTYSLAKLYCFSPKISVCAKSFIALDRACVATDAMTQITPMTINNLKKGTRSGRDQRSLCVQMFLYLKRRMARFGLNKRLLWSEWMKT